MRPNQTLGTALFHASVWKRWEILTANTAVMIVCDNPSRSAACQNSQTSSSRTNNHVTFTVAIVTFIPSAFTNHQSYLQNTMNKLCFTQKLTSCEVLLVVIM